MQISVKVATEGIQKPNRRAFLLLVRLKMAFSHGWVCKTPLEISEMVGLSESTVKRRLYKLEQLGYIKKERSGVYTLKNLNPRKRPLNSYERDCIKRGTYKPILSTVRLTKWMGDQEIIAHLTSKVGGKYCRECEHLFKVKEDNELMSANKPLKSFDSVKIVRRKMSKYKPVSPIPNKNIVISDVKMSARLGISLSDFRTNVKPFWRIYGTLSWSANLVQLNMSREEIRYGNLPAGVFVHKANAYVHSTRYFNLPKL